MARVGQQLDQYELIERLGEGMVGTVFQARDVDLDRIVAVKVWREETAVFLKHYLPRLQMAANLRHPAIVRLHDIYAGPPPYVVSAYLPHPFTDRLPSAGTPLAPEQWPHFLLLLSQAAAALDHAHRRGLLHGHLKPTNLHLKPDASDADDPALVITDFGLAPPRMRDVRGQPYLDTLHYCAPEQLRGEADGRSDIYSLGVLLYRLATGRLPYTVSTREEAQRRHSDRPPRLAELASQTPPALANLIRQAMAPDPVQRFHDAAALATALRRLAEGPGLRPATPASPRRQSETVERRRPAAPDAPPLIGDLRLALTPAALTIDPGDSGEMRLELHNQSPRVGQFTLELEGWPAEWVTVSPPAVQLLPEAKQTAVIRLHPPRHSNAAAGDHSIALVARERGRADARQAASATVHVAPFTNLDTTLRPQQIRNSGACHLTLINKGNAPLDFHVGGRDPAEALRFGGDGQRGHLSPGEETTVTVTVTPRAPRPWLGRRQTLPFSLNVAADQMDEPQAASGQLELRPRIPSWLPVLLTTLITIACVALGFFLALN